MKDKNMIDEKINAIRSKEIEYPPLATLGTQGLIIQSMLRPDLSYQISKEGKVISTYWAITREDLWADTRRHISKGELARMKTLPWEGDARLDWLLQVAKTSGLSLDLLESYTRPLFNNATQMEQAA